MTLHQHRQFDLSIPYLERAVSRLGGGRTVSGDREFEVLYAIARGYFWREQFRDRRRRFGTWRCAPAPWTSGPGCSTSRPGAWSCWRVGRGRAAFRRAYLTDQQGTFGGPAVLSALRLEWRGGKEAPALQLLSVLCQLAGPREYTSRAYLFLAVSDLVRGRRDRAGLARGRRAAGPGLGARGRLLARALAELRARRNEPGAADRAVEPVPGGGAGAARSTRSPLDARARFALAVPGRRRRGRGAAPRRAPARRTSCSPRG